MHQVYEKEYLCEQNLITIQEILLCENQNEIEDFKNISKFPNLQFITISNSHIDDKMLQEIFSQVTNYESTVSIDIENVPIVNVEAFFYFKNLESISFFSVPLQSINGISVLNKLKSISLHKTKVSDLKPLSGFVCLDYLSISRSPVSDITPLMGMNIKNLNIGHTNIINIEPVLYIENIRYLNIDNLKLPEIAKEILSKMDSLEVLSMINVNFEDLSFLKSLHDLKSLDTNKQEIKNLDFIEHAVHLEYLNITESTIEDLSSINRYTKMKKLYFGGSTIYDLTPLYTMTWLEEIDLTDAKYPKGQLEALKAALPKTNISVR